MAMVEISIVPVGTKSPSVSAYVARAIEILEKSGLKYELGPMGTVIEGDLDIILKVAAEMHRSTFDAECLRVVTNLKIDERRDKPMSMQGKIRAVKKRLKAGKQDL